MEKKEFIKLIKGLKFNDAKAATIMKEGRQVVTCTVTERALKTADVLSHRDYGQTVVIVTKDGRKHTVDKK